MYKVVSALFLLWLAPCLGGPGSLVVLNSTPPGYPAGIIATIDPSGIITIAVPDTNSNFTIPVGQSLDLAETRYGADKTGRYAEADFKYNDGGARTGFVRNYLDEAEIRFGVKFVDAALNMNPFPRFTDFPSDWMGFSPKSMWDYQLGENGWLDKGSYWLSFDSNGNSYIFSAATDHMTARNVSFPDSSFSSVIDPNVSLVPAATSHESVLVFGRSIHSAYSLWGKSLGADRSLMKNIDRMLEFWTDAGTFYYYIRGSFLNFEDMFEQVGATFVKNGFPLPDEEADSYRYPKGYPPSWENNTGFGAYNFDEDQVLHPEVGWLPFPTGLAKLHQRLLLQNKDSRISLHLKYVDPHSLYVLPSFDPQTGTIDMNPVVGNMISSLEVWREVAQSCTPKGAKRVIQDWLSWIAPTLTTAELETALRNMHQAFSEQGIQIMFCMPLSGHVQFAGAELPFVTSVRISPDVWGRNQYVIAIYLSEATVALGMNGFVDNLDTNKRMDLLTASWLRSFIAVGNSVNTINWVNLRRVVRSDGYVLMPDESLRALDSMLIQEHAERVNKLAGQYIDDPTQVSTPLVAAAFTNNSGLRAAYVLACARQPWMVSNVTVQTKELGLSGPVYVYDLLGQSGQVYSGGSFPAIVDYFGKGFVVVPVGSSGIAFLGDLNTDVPLARKFITELSDDGTTVRTTVAFTPGQNSVVISFWASSAPLVTVNGHRARTAYDPSTGLFHVTVLPDGTGQAKVEMSLSAGHYPVPPRR